MNNLVYYDICSILVIAILIHIVYTRRNIEVRTNRVLMALMTVTIISAVSDLVAAIAENGIFPVHTAIVMAYFANYIYFIAHPLIFPMLVLYIYASFDLWSVFRKNFISETIWVVLNLIDLLLLITNPFTHQLFYISEKAEYVRGELFYGIYVVAGIFAGWSIGTVIYHRAHASKLKFIVLLMMFPIVFGAIFLQSILPNYLVECFAIALLMLFFIIVIHRNENPVDPNSGAMRYGRAIERVKMALDFKRPFAVVMFKVTNYNNIHLYLGQERLVEYLNILSEKFRETARQKNYIMDVYYIENGSFAMFCDDNDKEKALEFANELVKYANQPTKIGHLKIFPEAVACAVECPREIDDFPTLLTVSTSFSNIIDVKKGLVDYADYKDTRDIKIRNNINTIIERGLANNRFEMYYQPIFSVVENRFVSAEALIRLRDEEYGYISPGIFIPAAEKSGAIHEIGDFVFRDVFRFIAENDIKKIGLNYIEINLSASQCIEADIVEKIDRLMKEMNITPDKISMELTEMAADINPVVVDENVKKLHDLGIRFALDDYGTGYSNIRRVTSLPFDQVKLDRCFIEDIDNPVMWNVIKDTIAMFKEMGKEILVEGIEQESVGRKLSEIKTDLMQGCELMQGFYFCRPMPENEFWGFMEARVSQNKELFN